MMLLREGNLFWGFSSLEECGLLGPTVCPPEVWLHSRVCLSVRTCENGVQYRITWRLLDSLCPHWRKLYIPARCETNALASSYCVQSIGQRIWMVSPLILIKTNSPGAHMVKNLDHSLERILVLVFPHWGLFSYAFCPHCTPAGCNCTT